MITTSSKKINIRSRLRPVPDSNKLSYEAQQTPPPYQHCCIARFLRIDPKLNQVVPWSLHTFPENFMQMGPAVFLVILLTKI